MAITKVTRLTKKENSHFETLNAKDYKKLTPKEKYEFHLLQGRRYMYYKQTKKYPQSTRTFYKKQGKLQLNKAENLKRKYKLNV
jgi:hypothetical protein